MRTEHMSILTLVAGIWAAAVAGCDSSERVSDASRESSGGKSSGVTLTGGSEARGGTSQRPTGAGGSRAPGRTTSEASTAKAAGGALGSGGTESIGGAEMGGADTGSTKTTGGAKTTGGGSAAGGRTSTVSSSALSPAAGGAGTGGKTAVATGGQPATGGSSASATGGATNTGPCSSNKSKTVSSNARPTGPHKVVMETNSDIACGTIYRPEDLGGSEKYPIFVWGEGACSRDGRANEASMAEIASHGYFVIADGPPSGGNCSSIGMPGSSADLANMSKTLLSYVTWAIAEAGKSCSAYYGSIDATKVAADGFSCGGLMAESTGGDPRLTAWGVTSSGITYGEKDFYKTIHTPVKILEGGSVDIAYKNGLNDYNTISALGKPVIFLSKDGANHGGDLGNGTGDFNSVNLAWINWHLKGDMGATGKGALVGSTCKYCKAAGWEYKAANIE